MRYDHAIQAARECATADRTRASQPVTLRQLYVADFSRVANKAALAAPLARRQRRALP
jgi:hypothetical protein